MNIDPQETQKKHLPLTQRETLPGTQRETTPVTPKNPRYPRSSTPRDITLSLTGIYCSYSLMRISNSVTPERSTHKTKVVPVIIIFPKADKDVVTYIRKVHKLDKEANVPVLIPSSVSEK